MALCPLLQRRSRGSRRCPKTATASGAFPLSMSRNPRIVGNHSQPYRILPSCGIEVAPTRILAIEGCGLALFDSHTLTDAWSRVEGVAELLLVAGVSQLFLLCKTPSDAVHVKQCFESASHVEKLGSPDVLKVFESITRVAFAQKCAWTLLPEDVQRYNLIRTNDAAVAASAHAASQQREDTATYDDSGVLFLRCPMEGARLIKIPASPSMISALESVHVFARHVNWKRKALRSKSEVCLGFGFEVDGSFLDRQHKALLASTVSPIIPSSFLDFVKTSCWDNRGTPNQVSIIRPRIFYKDVASSGKTALAVMEPQHALEDFIAYTCCGGPLRLVFQHIPLSTTAQHGALGCSVVLAPGYSIALTGSACLNWTCTALREDFSSSDGYLLICRRIKATAIPDEASCKARPPLPPCNKTCIPVSAVDGEDLEQRYVHHVYDRIACHFSHTRHSPWPRVAALLQSLPRGSLVIDSGCGNGKYASCNREIAWIGSDHSAELLKCCIAKTTTPRCELYVADCLHLSLRSNVADVCLAIAVLHHFQTEAKRLAALNEMLRCVRPGGKLVVYVWAIEQLAGTVGARQFESQDVLVPWHLQKHLDTQETSKDDIHSGSNSLRTLYRYYHVFREEEITALCRRATGAVVDSVTYDANNWAVVLTKQSS